jgi:hypothetical protein
MNQLTTKFDATTGESNGTRPPASRSLMDRLAGVLIRFGILTEDLDYHLIRASMVIIFFAVSRKHPLSRFQFAELASELPALCIDARECLGDPLLLLGDLVQCRHSFYLLRQSKG